MTCNQIPCVSVPKCVMLRRREERARLAERRARDRQAMEDARIAERNRIEQIIRQAEEDRARAEREAREQELVQYVYSVYTQCVVY